MPFAVFPSCATRPLPFRLAYSPRRRCCCTCPLTSDVCLAARLSARSVKRVCFTRPLLFPCSAHPTPPPPVGSPAEHASLALWLCACLRGCDPPRVLDALYFAQSKQEEEEEGGGRGSSMVAGSLDADVEAEDVQISVRVCVPPGPPTPFLLRLPLPRHAFACSMKRRCRQRC